MSLRSIFNALNKRISGNAAKPDQTDSSSEFYLSANAVRQLNRLQLNASSLLPGYQVGLRRSQRRRPSADFHEHRLYIPGDDVRFVDWKASARQEHIFVKQGEYPKEATIFILLDCSASMAWGDPPKRITALKLAAALSFLALAHGDRLVVNTFSSGVVQSIGPISGKGQYPNLVNFLRGLTFKGETALDVSLREFSQRIAMGTGLVLILSDFLSTDHLEKTFSYLPAPRWDVVIFHLLHPEELNPVVHGDFEMQDIETGHKINYDVDVKALAAYQEQIQTWRRNLEIACIDANAFYTLIPTHWSFDSQILPHLRDINVVKVL